MCVPGCHATIHNRLSRRGFFKGGAAAVAAGGLTAAATQPAAAKGAKVFHRAVDLSHALTTEFPTYIPDWALQVEQLTTFKENGFNTRRYTMVEHCGTHIDAPIHFSEDGQTADEIPLDDLILPLAVVDVREKAAEDADYQLTPDDLKAWISQYGELPEGACVAMNSGWAAKAPGDEFANRDGDGVMHFPGFHIEATKMMMEAGAMGMASDTLSLDHGSSSTFDTHYAWLPSGRWGIENIAGLDDVPATGATIVVATPKIAGATGCVTRVMALV